MGEPFKCAAGHVGNLSVNCVGTNPNEEGYRCHFCAEVVERYARTRQNIRARRNSVTNMIGVKKAFEIQRGHPFAGQRICSTKIEDRYLHHQKEPVHDIESTRVFVSSDTGGKRTGGLTSRRSPGWLLVAERSML
jgi:hypothetical protein